MESLMISARDAAVEAVKYLKELYPDTGLEPRIEEIELSDREDYWHITLSYSVNAFDPRQLKIFTIDSSSGAVKAMKIRTLR